MTIIRPRFVAIDSSTLNKLEEGLRATDSLSRQRAVSVMDSLGQDHWIPVITIHHLAEVIQVTDVGLAHERLRFLTNFPLLAYVKPIQGAQFPASIVDIFAREVAAVISGVSTIPEIISKVRDELINVVTGQQLFSTVSRNLDHLRSHALTQHRENIEITSIARSDAAGTRDVKFKDILTGRQRTRMERLRSLAKYERRLKDDLMTHGDKRLAHSDSLADEFTSRTSNRIGEIPENAPFAVSRMLDSFGLKLSDIDPEMTMEDVGFLVTFRANLDIVRPLLNCNAPLSVRDIDQEICPSWRMSREVQRRQNREVRVRGSNLTDSHLAGLAFYVDAIDVDKRTFEFIRQIGNSDPVLKQYTKRVIKCSDYTDLSERLRELGK